MKRCMALLGDTPVSVIINDLRLAVDSLATSQECAGWSAEWKLGLKG